MLNTKIALEWNLLVDKVSCVSDCIIVQDSIYQYVRKDIYSFYALVCVPFAVVTLLISLIGISEVYHILSYTEYNVYYTAFVPFTKLQSNLKRTKDSDKKEVKKKDDFPISSQRFIYCQLGPCKTETVNICMAGTILRYVNVLKELRHSQSFFICEFFFLVL